MQIKELPIEWRKHYLPAYFRKAFFHVEIGGTAGGRRVALHEFPKRNEPYVEDMGRRAIRWTVQGYLIISPMNTNYIPQRDALIAALEADGPGPLKLPTFEPMIVMCDQFRCDETRERGGMAMFDMVFIERGKPVSYDVQPDTRGMIGVAANETTAAAQEWIDTMARSGAGGPGGSMVQDAADAFMGNFGGGGRGGVF